MPAAGQQRNLILDQTPEDELNPIRHELEPVPLRYRETLVDADDSPDFVYFVESGVLSVVHVLEDGTMVEVGVVGNEGFVGVGAVLTASPESHRVVVQGEGHALRIRSSVLAREMARTGTFRQRLNAYIHFYLLQLAQTAVCNRLHSVSQRLARWILLIDDRSPGNSIQMTQEFLSYILGTRRASINEGIRMLTEANLIEHGRSAIRIRDRVGLEAIACECYRTLRNHHSRLLTSPS